MLLERIARRIASTLPGPVRMRPGDVMRIAGEAVAADLGQRLAAPPRREVRLGLEDHDPRTLAEEQTLAIVVEGLHRSGVIAPRRTKPANSSFSRISVAPVIATSARPGADLVGRETDGVVPRRARRGERLHHAAGVEGARDVDGQERRAVALQLHRVDGVLAFVDPGSLELAEDVGLAHGRAEDHGGARIGEVLWGEARALHRLAGRGEGESRAPPGVARFGRVEVVAGTELLHLTRHVAVHRGGVEGLHLRCPAPAIDEGLPEGGDADSDGADHAHPCHEHTSHGRAAFSVYRLARPRSLAAKNRPDGRLLARLDRSRARPYLPPPWSPVSTRSCRRSRRSRDAEIVDSRFVGTDRQERYFTYEEMWQEANRRAAFLRAMGLEKGDRLALVVPEGHEFVLSFFGAVVAGIVPVPMFPRATFKGVDGYVDILAHIVEASGAKVMLSMETLRPIIDKVKERDVELRQVAMCETAFEGETPAFERPEVTPEDLCFLQFTSGSTSRPKGVMVTHENLVANASCFLGPAPGLDRNDDDVGVSWLPLFHDMGLIGFILGTIVCDIPVVIIPTAQFARAPRLWLETIHKHRGTITYAPNFAYELVAKRVRDKDLESLDLSCIRVAGCGAEPIRAKSLAAFAERLAPAGFDGDKAFLPSYGMAERPGDHLSPAAARRSSSIGSTPPR